MLNGLSTRRTEHFHRLAFLSSLARTVARELRQSPRILSAIPVLSCHSRIPLLLFFSFVLFVAAPLHAANTDTIVIFGDSLTAGYGLDDPATEAYPALLQKKIDAARLPFHVVNAGLSGETSAAGLRRVDWILRQSVGIFVLALGANDGLRGIDPAVTRENLQGILDRVRAKNPAAKLVVAGMMMPESMGPDYAKSFATVFRDLAEKNHAALIPFLLAGVAGDPALNQPDRIHPTAAAEPILADNVWKILRPLL